LSTATDHRSLNVARNVRSQELRDKLEGAAEHAVRAAVSDAVADEQVYVMFLVDKSGSMQGAIDKSKEALVRILAGFPIDRVHIATFDTVGRVLRPKATSRIGISHLLDPVHAGGGTTHAAAVRAFAQGGVRIPADATLIVIVVGDEAGEAGEQFARSFAEYGYRPAAIALILNVERASWRGSTVRDAAAHLVVPYSEVAVEEFADPNSASRRARPRRGRGWPSWPTAVSSRRAGC
jgi:hypothetical protein